jgi:hypothetical protein
MVKARDSVRFTVSVDQRELASCVCGSLMSRAALLLNARTHVRPAQARVRLGYCEAHRKVEVADYSSSQLSIIASVSFHSVF